MTVRALWGWLQATSKAPPVIEPWMKAPTDLVTDEHLWAIVQAHEARDRRWKRGTWAFVAMMNGPQWGTMAAIVFNNTVGALVGVGIVVPCGIAAAYWRGE